MTSAAAPLFPHHAETLSRVSEHFSREPGVIALLLGGSIAHGFHSAEADDSELNWLHSPPPIDDI